MTLSVTETAESTGFTPLAIPSPTLVAARLVDGIAARWRFHWHDHGQLNGSWVGGPATAAQRAELLIFLADVVVGDLHPSGAWSVVLDVDEADEPVSILASDRRQTHEIAFQFSSRAVRVGDRIAPLGLADSGRRVLEMVAIAIGAALGEPTPEPRRKGRRQHDA